MGGFLHRARPIARVKHAGIPVAGADPVAKISIIPRGIAALGYTTQLPTEERYLMTRSELQARIDVLLGGRVAEEIVFGDVSTGAQNDLQRGNAPNIPRSAQRDIERDEIVVRAVCGGTLRYVAK